MPLNGLIWLNDLTIYDNWIEYDEVFGQSAFSKILQMTQGSNAIVKTPE